MTTPPQPGNSAAAPKAKSKDHSDKPTGSPLLSLDSAVFQDVRVTLEAKLGEVTLSIEDLLQLRSGAVLKLDVQLNEPVELRLNQSAIARGEIIALEGHFGVRISEVSAQK